MKKIDKNYLVLCKRLFVILPRLRKFTTDKMIITCVSSSCNIDYKDWKSTYSFCLNDKALKLFDDLDSIVRGLLPYLTEETIMQLCNYGGNV